MPQREVGQRTIKSGWLRKRGQMSLRSKRGKVATDGKEKRSGRGRNCSGEKESKLKVRRDKKSDNATESLPSTSEIVRNFFVIEFFPKLNARSKE